MESDRVVDVDDGDYTCPLCVEELDIQDRGFKPCPCGYQVCPFCWHHIRNNMNGLCPACRRPYSDQPEWKPVAQEEYVSGLNKGINLYSFKQEQLRIAKKKDKKHHQPDLPNAPRKSEPVDSRKHLQGVRVTQKNLVYVIGLTLKLLNDEALALLRGQEYFGQYGKIQKIMINKRKDIPPLRGGTFDKSGSSVSVYVTFLKKEDASRCIVALDGSMVDGNTLRAAYGTTKYCTAFLQHRQCQNPSCMYLHSEQDQDDTESHTREETSTFQHAQKMGQSKPTPGPVTTKSPSTEEKPERPILPTSVSWAKAAVGARAHSPPAERIPQIFDQRRPSIPFSVPSQPSPTSTPTPPPFALPQVASEGPYLEIITPSEISLALATSDQRSRIAVGIFDRILENFKKGSFKFDIGREVLDSDDFRLAAQATAFFTFKKDMEASETSDTESKDTDPKQGESTFSPKPRGFDPFASTVENGTHKRQQSRFAYVNDPISKAIAQPVAVAGPTTQLARSFSPPRVSDPVLAQLPGSHNVSSQFKNATPPPPGMYYSHAQQYDHQRRQQLLEQQRMQNYNPDYEYYSQVSGGRNYASYDEQEHSSVYAPQARRHLLDTQGRFLLRVR
jgi:RING/Ubox like zinc-binding domain